MALRDGNAGTTAEFGSRADRLAMRLLGFTSAAERELWIGAVALMLGDLVLTVYGLELGLSEMNPLALAAMDAVGYAGLGVLKTVGLGIAACLWALVPGRYASLVPLGLLLPSAAAVGVNATLILHVT